MTEPLDSGVAGASARREYDRRRAKDEARVRDTWGQGRIGSIAVALTPERQSTTAWRGGAGGEEEVGRALDAVASDRIRVLHDRKIPRSKANIDHIVVTPSGVWVIDTKRYVQQRPALRVEGGLFSPRVEKLLVGGRQNTRLVEGVHGQVERVSAVVGETPVRGVLCFVNAEWPLFGGDFTVQGVDVVWPKLLQKRLRAAADADAVCDVGEVAAAVAREFRASMRRQAAE